MGEWLKANVEPWHVVVVLVTLMVCVTVVVVAYIRSDRG